jgi:hypothetical protein
VRVCVCMYKGFQKKEDSGKHIMYGQTDRQTVNRQQTTTTAIAHELIIRNFSGSHKKHFRVINFQWHHCHSVDDIKSSSSGSDSIKLSIMKQ